MDAPLRINPHVARVVPPSIDRFNRRIAQLRARGADVISLAQAVASFMPPAPALEAVRAVMTEPWVHVYSHDAGWPPARAAVARWVAAKGLVVDPDTELLLTAGASQAFFLALLTLAGPGDAVVLPTPYYFDHQYAAVACGCRVVEVPMVVGDGRWRFDVPALVAAARNGARVIVLVTPNNPTGAVASPDELAALAAGLDGTGTAVITDETYDRFVFGDEPFLSPVAVPGLTDRTVVVGSFSKSLALAGWRMGYLAAPAPVVAEARKLQDTMVICAPVPSQVAVAAALGPEGEVAIEAGRRELMDRCAVLRAALDGSSAIRWREPEGAFFAFVALNDGSDDAAAADELLERHHVAVMPGSAFGAAGKGHLRLSFGNVAGAELREAGRRLSAHFGA